MTAPTLCVPPWDSCANYWQGHYCQKNDRHAADHVCECGQTWPVDRNYELAVLLYLEHWTTRYKDELHRPPMSAAEIACRPLDSDWRRKALVAETYLRGRL